MVTSHSTYVILSITPTSPFCAFIQDFLVSHQKFLVGLGRGARRENMGKRSDFHEIKCVYPWLATFGLCAKL